jgi:hypothetical protein
VPQPIFISADVIAAVVFVRNSVSPACEEKTLLEKAYPAVHTPAISIVHAVFKRRAIVIKDVSTVPEFLCRKSTGFLLQIVPRTGQLRLRSAYAAPWRVTGADHIRLGLPSETNSSAAVRQMAVRGFTIVW